jgi:Xaa-Pro aminopeptidase
MAVLFGSTDRAFVPVKQKRGDDTGLDCFDHGLIAAVAGAHQPLAAGHEDDWMRLLGRRMSPGEKDACRQALIAERSRQAAEQPLSIAERVARVRELMGAVGIQWMLVPHGDQHGLEFMPPHDERLRWLTGFSGSAGFAIVGTSCAIIHSDGRYRLQLAQQIDQGLFQVAITDNEEKFIAEWLCENVKSGEKVGYDPWLFSPAQVAAFGKAMASWGGSLEPLKSNLIDVAWGASQPPAPVSPVVMHPLRYAGKSRARKIADVAKQLRAGEIYALLETNLNLIAWLLNIRGGDVPYTPLALSYCIVYASGRVDVYIDTRKLTGRLIAALERLRSADIRFYESESFVPQLKQGLMSRRVQVDPKKVPSAVVDALKEGGASIVEAPDPLLVPAAVRTAAELEGAVNAHVRDGAALVEWLCWLDQHGPRGNLTERQAAGHLLEIRRRHPMFRDLSFPTILGVDANGAIVHGRPTDCLIRFRSVVLCDSGAQYLDGTTDVTRTTLVGGSAALDGAPPELAQLPRHYTLVLKGHIAVAMARFPAGSAGQRLDFPARAALLAAGLDFDHAVSHGVGAYLGVHDGPQRISYRLADQPLLPGMMLSNEPGYYRQGQYGIRLENVQYVTRATAIEGGEREMLGFEPLTMAPFDRNLIDPALLTGEEIAWLEAYHDKVFRTLSPLLSPDARWWLKVATRPLV